MRELNSTHRCITVHNEALTRLTLSHNKITSVPANIADLVNLQVCLCSYCHLQLPNVESSEWSRLPPTGPNMRWQSAH